MQQETRRRAYAYVRPWTWKHEDRTETPGVGIFRGRDLIAHLTPDEARTMADQLHDQADRTEQETN